MPIPMSCPQCKQAYRLSDDKQGKQIRCRACSHVFRVVKPPANGAIAPRPAPAGAPRKAGAVPRPAVAAAAGIPRLWLIGLIVGGAVLLLGGGTAVALVVLSRLNNTKPDSVAAAPTAPTPPAPQGNSSAPNDVKPPNTSAGDPAKPPNTGNTNPPNPPNTGGDPPKPAATMTWDTFAKVDRGMTMDQLVALAGPPTNTRNVDPAASPTGADTLLVYEPEPNVKFTVEMLQGKVIKKINNQNRPNLYPNDTAGNAPAASTLTKENFDKIDRGMTEDQVIALLGPTEGGSPPSAQGERILSWSSRELKIAVNVTFKDGKVTDKSAVGKQSWRSIYPSDVAKNPPATKVAITQDLFNQIDRGMTMDQVVALAGQPTGKDDLSRLKNPDVDTRLSWDNYVADIGFTVDMVQGKVTSKTGYSKGKLWPVVYPSGAAPTKPVGTLTRASFDKIDKGMSQDDVVALIGQPTVSLKMDPAKFQGVDTELSFISINPNAAATVDLFQGKVVKKTNPQNWPIVYPSDKK